MTNVLLSFVGDNDPTNPFGAGPGPNSTFLRHAPDEIQPDLVLLFHTDGRSRRGTLTYAERAEKTAEQLMNERPGVRARAVVTGISDPSDFSESMKAMERVAPSEVASVKSVERAEGREPRFHINVSPGTQQIMWTWISLVQLRLLDARIWQVVRERLAARSEPIVREFKPGRGEPAFLADLGGAMEMVTLERDIRRFQAILAANRWAETVAAGDVRRPGESADIPADFNLTYLLDLLEWNWIRRAFDDTGSESDRTGASLRLQRTRKKNETLADRFRRLEASLGNTRLGLRLLPFERLLQLEHWIRSAIPGEQLAGGRQ